MLGTLLFLLTGLPAGVDTLEAPLDYAPRLESVSPRRFSEAALHGGLLPPDTTKREHAVVLSDGYYTRLKIHKIASYLTIPLFVAQYAAGQELYQNGNNAASWAKDLHAPLAAAIGGLFVVNTVTGVWNMVEAWKVPEGRARRTIHSLLMLVADAGMVAVASSAPESEYGESGGGEGGEGGNATTHRNLAIGSMSIALGSYLMMLIWK